MAGGLLLRRRIGIAEMKRIKTEYAKDKRFAFTGWRLH
jgi:hypothetical protein